MNEMVTHWLTYGEPTENDRVEATHTIEYNGDSENHVREGTISMAALDHWDEHDEHVHDDGSLMLSGLSYDEHEAVMDSFREE